MHLLTPFQLRNLSVPNRVFMAPLTRTRADAHNIPGELMASYYAQRASAGLIFAEATMIAADAQAWPQQPGIHSSAHIAGWKKVTTAVHAAGGRIFLQIWHPGRATHPDLNAGVQPVSSSDKPIRDDTIHTFTGKKPYPTPRRLRIEEIPTIVAQFRHAAENAQLAGFDGVQVHGAHGYLIDQFLRDGVNDRTDSYGGSVAHRARFLFEVIDAAVSVWGPERVGFRISPLVAFNDMTDSDAPALVTHIAREADRRQLNHFELRHADSQAPAELALAHIARENFHGPLLRNGGFNRETGEAALRSGLADAIVYGMHFLTNPDLPRRFLLNSPLNPPDPATLYAHDAKGYTDYPFLAA